MSAETVVDPTFVHTTRSNLIAKCAMRDHIASMTEEGDHVRSAMKNLQFYRLQMILLQLPDSVKERDVNTTYLSRNASSATSVHTAGERITAKTAAVPTTASTVGANISAKTVSASVSVPTIKSSPYALNASAVLYVSMAKSDQDARSVVAARCVCMAKSDQDARSVVAARCVCMAKSNQTARTARAARFAFTEDAFTTAETAAENHFVSMTKRGPPANYAPHPHSVSTAGSRGTAETVVVPPFANMIGSSLPVWTVMEAQSASMAISDHAVRTAEAVLIVSTADAILIARNAAVNRSVSIANGGPPADNAPHPPSVCMTGLSTTARTVAVAVPPIASTVSANLSARTVVEALYASTGRSSTSARNAARPTSVNTTE